MMRLVLPLFLCSQYAAAIQVRAANSSIKNSEVNKWLVTHIVPATWSNAAVHCQLEGGILASPTTHDIAQAMFRAMAIDARLSSGGVFIGVTNAGHFVSLDGVPFADIPLEWAAGEPNNAGDVEKCLAITGKNELADVSCVSLLPFFCLMQSAHEPSTPIKMCKGKEGYEWEPRTGSCYKFHPIAKTWPEALKTCEAEGGYLAIINSKTEATVLTDILSNNESQITGSYQNYYNIFVGAKKVASGIWMTIHGQTLSEAGYEVWGYLDNNVDNNCICMNHKTGAFYDDFCTIQLAYFCEMTSS